MKNVRSCSVLALICFSFGVAFADDIPECLDNGEPIAINNAQVLEWKTSTDNQYLARAHVQGDIVRLLHHQSGHNHFEIQLGSADEDLLEVVYDLAFGDLPALRTGMHVEACGDYITSTAQAGHYPPSPVGAIIHWVHMSPRLRRHPAGFLAINAVLYGQENPNDLLAGAGLRWYH